MTIRISVCGDNDTIKWWATTDDTVAKKMITIAMKKGFHFFEWVHKKINGEEFFATVLLTRVKIEEKVFLQATVRDISKQKKIEIHYPGGEDGEFWVQELTDWLVSLGIPSKYMVISPGSGADDVIKFNIIK